MGFITYHYFSKYTPNSTKKNRNTTAVFFFFEQLNFLHKSQNKVVHSFPADLCRPRHSNVPWEHETFFSLSSRLCVWTSASTVPILPSLTHLPIIFPVSLPIQKSPEFTFFTLTGSDMGRVLSYEVTLEHPWRQRSLQRAAEPTQLGQKHGGKPRDAAGFK